MWTNTIRIEGRISSEPFGSYVTITSKKNQGIDVCGLLAKVSGEEPKVWGNRIGGFVAECLFKFVCENMGKAFILGSLVGTGLELSKGMYLSPPKQRLIGGWRNVVKAKGGNFHHGPTVAAHVGLFLVYGLVGPAHPVTATAAYFGAVQFVRTLDFLKAGSTALAGGFVAFVLTAFRQNEN